MSASSTLVNAAAIHRQRLALGGRARDRIGKGREYVAHDVVTGAAALRRRRQMAKRDLFGCFACNEWTPAARLSIVDGGHRICDDCLIAAGLIPAAARVAIAAPDDHEVHQWEGEGGR